MTGIDGEGHAESRLRVGFAGMGQMGVPMARNLLRARFPLTVYNRTRERCEALAREGARVAGSPAELAEGADLAVTMLADAEAVRAVVAGDAGLLERMPAGATMVEMSTIGPVAARELAARTASARVGWLDAPVSGSVALAEAGTLTTMVGGELATFERARPALEAMTRAQHRLGPAGAGAAMKLAVNLLIASSAQAISEALVLAERSGIERADAYEVVASSAVASPFVDYKRAAFLAPNSEPPAFSLELMKKDLDLVLELGEERSVPLHAAAAAREAMAIAARLEGEDADLARVAEALRAIASQANGKEER